MNRYRLLFLIGILLTWWSGGVCAQDMRSYMHGIEAVPDGQGGWRVFFSSSGLPPTGPDKDRNWTQDIYVASWDKNTGSLGEPRVFIRNPEAQEPVSAARTEDSFVMLSFEDGYNNTEGNVSQRYGVYDGNLDPVKPYPNDVLRGGHSGHVAAVGNRFVVFYSEGWIDGGGVDNLGTGNGVYAKIYDSRGGFERTVSVAAKKREWWPMLAGSRTRALLLWQQYVPKKTYAKLKFALLDPATGKVSRPAVLDGNLQYYTYRVVYVPAVDRFLVTGTTVAGRGFAYLIDDTGRITATLSCMPPVVREAGIAVNGTMAYTPAAGDQLLHLALTGQTITVQGMQPSPLSWSYLGSVGLMRDETHLHWVSLTKGGLEEADFDLTAVTSAEENCR